MICVAVNKVAANEENGKIAKNRLKREKWAANEAALQSKQFEGTTDDQTSHGKRASFWDLAYEIL